MKLFEVRPQGQTQGDPSHALENPQSIYLFLSQQFLSLIQFLMWTPKIIT